MKPIKERKKAKPTIGISSVVPSGFRICIKLKTLVKTTIITTPPPWGVGVV
jgi:hypothetical protein